MFYILCSQASLSSRDGMTTTVTGVTVTVTSDSPQPPRAPEVPPRTPVSEKTSVKVDSFIFLSISLLPSSSRFLLRPFWRS